MAQALIRADFRPQRTERCFCGSGMRFKSCCGSMAKERPPPHGLHIVPSFLDASTCAQWVTLLEQQNREYVSIVDHLQSTSEKTVFRRDETRVTERVDAGPLKTEVDALVRNAVEEDIAGALQKSFAWFIGPQILRYAAGGHYALHADSDHWSVSDKCWVKGLDRDMSLLIYLNDSFSGGELSFPLFNYIYHPQPGDLLFFPSDFRYRHQAHPVTSGVRYVIVSWAAFLGEPRVLEQRPENRIDLD